MAALELVQDEADSLVVSDLLEELPASKMHKICRGNASQFFIAGELCRRGYLAVVTMGNTPNTDILCSNLDGTKFVHIQVKTYLPGKSTCTVGKKAEKNFGDNFFWVLGGIPEKGNDFAYYIIPSSIMSKKVTKQHQDWLNGSKGTGKSRKDSDIRTVHIPPHANEYSWDISDYKNKWSFIDEKLKA